MLPILTMPGHLIRRAHQLSSAVFAERVAASGHDITPVQFGALCAIRTASGLDQATLAEWVAYDRVTIGGVLDRLQAKGLIARGVSQIDRRARTLTLTPAGEAVLSALMPVVEEVQSRIVSALCAQEQTALVTLLKKMLQVADEAGEGFVGESAERKRAAG